MEIAPARGHCRRRALPRIMIRSAGRVCVEAHRALPPGHPPACLRILGMQCISAAAELRAGCPRRHLHLKTAATVSASSSTVRKITIASARSFRSRPHSGQCRRQHRRRPDAFEEYNRRALGRCEQCLRSDGAAAWCGEQGLTTERRQAPSIRRSSWTRTCPRAPGAGPVRVVACGSTTVAWSPGNPPAPTKEPADPQRLAQAIQRQWHLRIRALKDSLLGQRARPPHAAGAARASWKSGTRSRSFRLRKSSAQGDTAAALC